MKYLTDYIKEKNENTLVVGGTASGKTSLVVLPTLLQRDGSYIFYDATGMQYQKLAADFLRDGYRVRILNIKDKEKTDGYNPIAYVQKMEDAIMIAEYLVEKKEDVDVFFCEAEKQFLAACILFAAKQKVPNNNFRAILDVLKGCQHDQSFTICEYLQEQFSKISDSNVSNQLCGVVKRLSEKILKVLVVSACTKIYELADILRKDDINLPTISEQKTIVFLVPNIRDQKYNFILSLFIEQSARVLMKDTNKFPVSYVLDEFAQLESIHNLNYLLMATRRFHIKFMISVMDIEQIQMTYPYEWERLISSIQNVVYLRNYEPKTVNYMKKYFASVGVYKKDFETATGKDTSSELALYEQFLDKKIYGKLDDVILVLNNREYHVLPKHSLLQFFVEYTMEGDC